VGTSCAPTMGAARTEQKSVRKENRLVRDMGISIHWRTLHRWTAQRVGARNQELTVKSGPRAASAFGIVHDAGSGWQLYQRVAVSWQRSNCTRERGDRLRRGVDSSRTSPRRSEPESTGVGLPPSLEPSVGQFLRWGWIESLAAVPGFRRIIAAHAASRAAELPVDPSLLLSAPGCRGGFDLVHFGVSLSDPGGASKGCVLTAAWSIRVLQRNGQRCFDGWTGSPSRLRTWKAHAKEMANLAPNA
jgi:hypothetical protein